MSSDEQKLFRELVVRACHVYIRVRNVLLLTILGPRDLLSTFLEVIFYVKLLLTAPTKFKFELYFMVNSKKEKSGSYGKWKVFKMFVIFEKEMEIL